MRPEQVKYEVTLTTKEIDAATRQSIHAMLAKEIAERYQKAIKPRVLFRQNEAANKKE